MLVVVPELDGEAGRRSDAAFRAERAQHAALAEGDVRAGIGAFEYVSARVESGGGGGRRDGARGRDRCQQRERELESFREIRWCHESPPTDRYLPDASRAGYAGADCTTCATWRRRVALARASFR